jgi:hypothetical protein
LENLPDFSGRFKSLFKFFKDSKVESGPGFFALLMLKSPQLRNCLEYPMLATWKNCEFLQQDKAPILIFEVELVLDKLEKRSITGGPTCQPLGPNNSTTPAD